MASAASNSNASHLSLAALGDALSGIQQYDEEVRGFGFGDLLAGISQIKNDADKRSQERELEAQEKMLRAAKAALTRAKNSKEAAVHRRLDPLIHEAHRANNSAGRSARAAARGAAPGANVHISEYSRLTTELGAALRDIEQEYNTAIRQVEHTCAEQKREIRARYSSHFRRTARRRSASRSPQGSPRGSTRNRNRNRNRNRSRSRSPRGFARSRSRNRHRGVPGLNSQNSD